MAIGRRVIDGFGGILPAAKEAELPSGEGRDILGV